MILTRVLSVPAGGPQMTHVCALRACRRANCRRADGDACRQSRQRLAGALERAGRLISSQSRWRARKSAAPVDWRQMFSSAACGYLKCGGSVCSRLCFSRLFASLFCAKRPASQLFAGAASLPQSWLPVHCLRPAAYPPALQARARTRTAIERPSELARATS